MTLSLGTGWVRGSVRALAACASLGLIACGSDSNGSAAGGVGGGGSAASGGVGAASTGGSGNAGGSTGGTGQAGAATATGGSTGLDGPPKIMTLGDSITRATCWRALLWQELAQAHVPDFDLVGTLRSDSGCSPSGYDTDNQGYSSSLVTEIVAGITNARSCDPMCPTLDDLGRAFTTAQPAVVLMHFGTNDVWNGIAPATILSAYTQVVARARSANPNVRFLVAQIIPMSPSGCGACAARVQALNAEIPGWAAGTTTTASPITVVDQWTGFDDSTDTGDGVHPNTQGSQKIADKWFAALDPLF